MQALVVGHLNADFDSLASCVLGRLLHGPTFCADAPGALFLFHSIFIQHTAELAFDFVSDFAARCLPGAERIPILYPDSLDPLVQDWVNRNEAFLKSHDFITTLACPLGAQAVAAASAKDSHSEGLRLVIVDGRRRSRFTHAGPLLVPPGAFFPSRSRSKLVPSAQSDYCCFFHCAVRLRRREE
jgi:hypothetical protein